MASGWLPIVVESDLDAPGDDTDVLTAARIAAGYRTSDSGSADFQMPSDREGWTLRINVCCAAASIPKLVDDQGNAILLNGGAAVTAGQNLIEDFIPDPNRTYNFQLDTTDGAIHHLVMLVAEGPSV